MEASQETERASKGPSGLRYDPRVFRRAPKESTSADPVSRLVEGLRRHQQAGATPDPSRHAALVTFLQFYREISPRILNDLCGSLLPLWKKEECRGFPEGYWAWLERHGLPDTVEMAEETAHTLGEQSTSDAPAPRRMLRWFSEDVWEMFAGDRLENLNTGFPFQFETPGWNILLEREPRARRRIEKAFRAALTAHLEQQRRFCDLYSGIQSYRGDTPKATQLREALEWLARGQAQPDLSQEDLLAVDDDDPGPRSAQTLRRGLIEAAEAIGLEPARIRHIRISGTS